MRKLVDRLLALVLLIFAAPVICIAAILVRLTSPGPAFFVQHRIGLNGRYFRMFKLRSMHSQVETVAGRKRVTLVGRYLRRLSIDELPQLWNVVCGTMALVGPRPHPPELDARYSKKVPMLDHRYYVLPGMTGLAQIRGERGPIRSASDLQRRLSLDLKYIEKRSIPLDIFILYRTAFGAFIAPEIELRESIRVKELNR